MSEKRWVDDDHYRVVSDDGRRSWLYKAGCFEPDQCVEEAHHYSDGTTEVYEPPTFMESITGSRTPKK